MKHTMLFTTVAAGAAIFLALPVIFEVEEEAPAVIASQAENKSEPLTFNPEGSGADSLPILQGMQKKRNFFSNYAKKAGNFYKKGFDIITGDNGADAAPRNMPNKDYAVFYAGNTRDAYEEFPSELTENSAPDFYNNNVNNSVAAMPAVKQTGNKSAGVKGLYEISLTDIDRIDQKQVYGRVIRKVNSVFPDVRPKKTAVGLTSHGQKSAAGNILVAGTDNYFISALPNTFNVAGSGSDGFNGRRPSANSSGQPDAARQGASGSFGSASTRPSGTDNNLKGIDFEKQAARARGVISAAKDGKDIGSEDGIGRFSKDGILGTIAKGLGLNVHKRESGNSDASRGGAGGSTGNNNSQGQQGSRTRSPQNPSGGQNQSTPPSNNPANQKPSPPPFNKDAWTEKGSSSCNEEIYRNRSEELDAIKEKNKKGNPSNSEEKASVTTSHTNTDTEEYDERERIVPCDASSSFDGLINLVNIPDGKKPKAIAILGYDKQTNRYVVANNNSPTATGFEAAGFSYNIQGDKQGDMTAYTYKSEEEIQQLRNNKDILVFTIDKDDRAENSYFIEEKQTEYIPGINKLVKEVNERMQKTKENEPK